MSDSQNNLPMLDPYSDKLTLDLDTIIANAKPYDPNATLVLSPKLVDMMNRWAASQLKKK